MRRNRMSMATSCRFSLLMCEDRGDFGKLPTLELLDSRILARSEEGEPSDRFSSYELMGVVPRTSNDMSSTSDILRERQERNSKKKLRLFFNSRDGETCHLKIEVS